MKQDDERNDDGKGAVWASIRGCSSTEMRGRGLRRLTKRSYEDGSGVEGRTAVGDGGTTAATGGASRAADEEGKEEKERELSGGREE